VYDKKKQVLDLKKMEGAEGAREKSTAPSRFLKSGNGGFSWRGLQAN
jgi:hypothetical protein